MAGTSWSARQDNNRHPVNERTMHSEINSTANSTDGLRQQMAEGLLYPHSRLNANMGKTLEPAAIVYCKDARIWVGFDATIHNPALEQLDWPCCLAAETEEGTLRP